MALSGGSPSTPDDWVTIANREVQNITGSYRGQVSNDAKVTHALLGIEAMLKAILWKHHKWPTWPLKKKGYKFLYGHNLQHMLDQCPDQLRNALWLSADHRASWQTLANASLVHVRYSPIDVSDDDANAIIKAARGLDTGMIPWLRDRYQKMT